MSCTLFCSPMLLASYGVVSGYLYCCHQHGRMSADKGCQMCMFSQRGMGILISIKLTE